MTQVDRAGSLAELLVLEPLGDDRFLAPHPSHDPYGHTYGGQLAAQAMRAAADTVPTDRLPHSLHGYFLRAGSLDVPLIIAVDRERDGRAFSARHVRVLQGDDIVFSALVSFHRDEQTIDHHVHPLAPDAGDPDLLPEQPREGHNVLLEVRNLPPHVTDRWRSERIWLRPRGELPDDAVTRACVLTYVSDVGWAYEGVSEDERFGGPSLDHAVWFQRAVDVNDWMLVDLRPVSAAGARALSTRTVHDRHGTLAAWVTQEALHRAFE